MNAIRSRHNALFVALLCALSALVCTAQARDEFSLEEPSEPAADPERLAELTEVRSSIEFGFGTVSDDSFRFGRYTGLEQQGGYGVLNLDWYRRLAYDSGDGHYCRITASNLGLDSREANVQFGDQGNYGVWLSYDESPMFRSDSARSIYPDAGATRLTLPAGWVAAQNTAGMTALLPNLGPVDIQHERRRFAIGGEKQLPNRWHIKTEYRHENKEGVKTIGAVIGNSGGNPRAVLLPEPVDYETREVDAALSYNGARLQFEARYYLSLFDDANTALVWQNPYAQINGWQAGTGFPTGEGQLSLPPDNQFHQASLAFGYAFDDRSRLSADLALGRMTQDEAFLPYTINPRLAASITQPLPRDSLDGQIDTTVANLRYSARPNDRFNWNASLRFDDRDNQTPRNEYVYIGGDSANQNTAANSSTRRYNEPYSYRDSQFKLDGSYRFGSATRLAAAFERHETERTYSEREQADEDTMTLNFSQRTSDWLDLGLKWSHADRHGSTYHGNEPFLSGYAPGYTSTVAGGWENPPDLRKFHLADRRRDRAGLSATITPAEGWSLSLDGDRIDDDYRRSELGLTDSRIAAYTLDLSYAPSAHWSTYLFYTLEQLDLDQDGQSIRTATRIADATDPGRAWRARHRDDIDTGGVGFTCSLPNLRLELGADYVVARSHGDIDVSVGSGLTARPLPANKTQLHSLDLRAKYRLRDDLSLQLRFWNEKFRSSDFALDGIEANQLANVILLGEESPDYRVNALFLSVVYRFR